MPPVTLLIKPASGMCNLRCTYCFYEETSVSRHATAQKIMSVDLLERIVQRALEQADGACSFIFQGGEPTLAGLPFFEALIQFEAQYNRKGVRIHHALQTNGTLLDENWCAFFQKHHFLIGVSLDGDSVLHDHYRRDPSGKGTFSRVMHGIGLLKQFSVEFNILTVVTGTSAKKAREIYRFFKEEDLIYQQYIPCLDPLWAPRGTSPFSLTAEDYGQFLCDLFDLWFDDISHGTFVYNRFFENVLGMLKGYPPENCSMNGHCTCQFVLESDGSVYPCDFYVLPEYRLGNYVENSMDEIFRQLLRTDFLSAAATHPPECTQCRYYALCRGGCRRNRDIAPGQPLEKDYFCQSYQMFYRHSLPRLLHLANR